MSGKRSGQNAYALRKQTFPCPHKNLSHEEPLLRENQPPQPLSLSTQVCLSAILEHGAANVLDLVANEVPSNCGLQGAMNNNLQCSPLFEDDTNSQVADMF